MFIRIDAAFPIGSGTEVSGVKDNSRVVSSERRMLLLYCHVSHCFKIARTPHCIFVYKLLTIAVSLYTISRLFSAKFVRILKVSTRVCEKNVCLQKYAVRYFS